MTRRVDQAVQLYESGYNCAQSVVMAYCDLFEMDRKTAAKFSSGMGGGVGRMNEVCGTVSAMALLAGLKFNNNDPKDREKQRNTIKVIKAMAKAFKEMNGSIVCKQLLGIEKPAKPFVNDEGHEVPIKKKPCVNYVRHAAEIIEEFMLDG